MRRSVRCLIVGVDAVLGAGVVVAVHVGGRLPLTPALCVDGAVGVDWLSLVGLLAPWRRDSGASVDDDAGRPHQAVARYRTDTEPLARSHWRSRDWP